MDLAPRRIWVNIGKLKGLFVLSQARDAPHFSPTAAALTMRLQAFAHARPGPAGPSAGPGSRAKPRPP